ncbi:MAG: WD40/YVTN/BNR-like repeat-containing protein, partial [Vulcanimicrobiaceae bacterium]
MIRPFMIIACLLFSPIVAAAAEMPIGNLHWREVGPAVAGGRVTSVAGSSRNPELYYLGAAGGGVWKSTDGGAAWNPVFDKEHVGAIGAVAIDPSNDATVWVGTGESNPRNDVSYGDGIYKTTDSGKTWTNMGLRASKYISRILIDPKDPQHVIVGALGDVFADSSHRGVYVTFDGGKTWRKTLAVGPESGVSDLAMSPQTPNVIYAGVWEFQRRPWTFSSGGTNDGIYVSHDGGKTWNRLTGHGLPSGITGRIGLAVAPSDPNRVYALIESKHGILWRSDDAGATWTLVSSNTLVDQRPFYFSHVQVDPRNPDHLFTASTQLAESTNGGKTFTSIANNVHGDYHAIWIAPENPARMIVGEDGGYALTVDAGHTWTFAANLPIGQFYRVGLGNDNPYTICGGLQDNNSYCGPSNSLDTGGNTNASWYAVVYDDDGQWAIPDPHDPNLIWSDGQDGALFTYNRRTREYTFIQPYLTNSQQDYDISTSPYRFNWES